jgi:hypothetical protein
MPDDKLKAEWLEKALGVPVVAILAKAAGTVGAALGQAAGTIVAGAEAIKAEKDRRAAEKRVQDLINDTQRELGELLVDTGSLDQQFNGKMIEQYDQLGQELSDQLESAQASLAAKQALPEIVLQSWEKALNERGELRKVLDSNLNVDSDKKLKDAQIQVKQLADDLKKLQASAKRIEEEVKQIEDGEKWVGRMLKLNDAMEMLEGSVEAMEKAGNALIKAGAWGEGKIAAYAMLAKEGYTIATTSTIIEQGVKNLADYNIELAVVGEGFGSVEELERAIENKAKQIEEAGKELQRIANDKQKYERQYAQPVKGKAG